MLVQQQQQQQTEGGGCQQANRRCKSERANELANDGALDEAESS